MREAPIDGEGLRDGRDAIVVGLGPVGGILALLLSREGFRVTIVDERETPYDKPRAIVLDHEALRVLQFCGVDESFFAGLTPHTGTDFRGLTGQLIKLFDPQGAPFPLGWPPTTMFLQPELERALDAALSNREGVTVVRGAAVRSIEQIGDHVHAVIERPGSSSERLTGDWLVGCDGATSMVRRSLGIRLDDLAFDEWWIVVDAWLTGVADLPKKTTQYCWPSRPATFVVGPGDLRRWEMKILPDEDPASFADPERVIHALGRYVDASALEIWRSAVYRFHAVVASQWRSGRIFIAGDAAHQMPPFLGQGLCAGIRDAANLSWKLAQVARRQADEAVLDSYQIERRPHVQTIVGHAKEFGLVIGELDEARAAIRDEELGTLLRNGGMNTVRQQFIPPLFAGIVAAQAPLAGTVFPQPNVMRNGEAVRMDDLLPPEFLIVSDGDRPLGWLTEAQRDAWTAIRGLQVAFGEAEDGPGAADVHAFVESDGIVNAWMAESNVCVAIVRPDRYVYATAATRADLQRHLTDLLDALGAAHAISE